MQAAQAHPAENSSAVLRQAAIQTPPLSNLESEEAQQVVVLRMQAPRPHPAEKPAAVQRQPADHAAHAGRHI